MSTSQEEPAPNDELGSSELWLPKHVNAGPMLESPEDFPFVSESYLRRWMDPSTFALVGCAAGMTVMHDKIAAAAEVNSRFREQPWNRLFSTTWAAAVLVFGNETEALDGMANHLWNFHETVRGSHENIHYSANDADLQVYVLGCVFKVVEEANRRWVKPLVEPERAGLYQDVKTFGKMFGIQEDLLPDDVVALDDYWNEMLDGDELLQTDVSRRMARAVFRFQGPSVPEHIGHLGQIISIASLDRRLQDKADLHLTKSEERINRAIDFTARNTYGRTPDAWRRQAIPAFLTVNRYIGPQLGRLLAKLDQTAA